MLIKIDHAWINPRLVGVVVADPKDDGRSIVVFPGNHDDYVLVNRPAGEVAIELNRFEAMIRT